jgi:hypothetical protein
MVAPLGSHNGNPAVQFEFLAQPPMVAALGLLQPVQVVLEVLRREERRPIDAL